MAPQAHIEALTHIVLNNLENQHDWKSLKTYARPSLPRELITGLPPRRLYIHPDEQLEIIKAEKNRSRIPQEPEFEWVLPIHLSERWTLKAFAEVFDAIENVPPDGLSELQPSADGDASWKQWRGTKRGKRLLLATIQDDSTVTYYLMHDGIVKPRQN